MFGKKRKELEGKVYDLEQTILNRNAELGNRRAIITRYQGELDEYRETWKSPDGQIILEDFQRALNLILAYQGSLKTLCAPDPHVVDARLLLAKYGQKGMTSAHGVPGLEEFIQVRESEEASGKLKG